MIKAMKLIIFGVVLCSCSACADLQQNSPQGRSSIQVWLFQRWNLSDLGVASTVPLHHSGSRQAGIGFTRDGESYPREGVRVELGLLSSTRRP
jgi:hypothetical protein